MNTPAKFIDDKLDSSVTPAPTPAETAAHHIVDLTQNNDVSELLPDVVAAKEQGVTIIPNSALVPEEPNGLDVHGKIVEDAKRPVPTVDNFIENLRRQFPLTSQPGWGESKTGFRTTGGGFGDH